MKKKIVFILPNLLTGGTQRAMVNVANGLAKTEFEIIFIITNKISKNYSNNPHIEKKMVSNFDENRFKTIFLDCDGVKWSIFKIRKELRKENPDILFTSLSYFNLYLSIFRFLIPKKILLIARETNILSVKHEKIKYKRATNFIYKLAYKNIDFVVCQSEDMKNDLIDNFGVISTKTIVINNPVDTKEIIKKSCENDIRIDESFFNIISVGHLTKQKGHGLLISAVSRLDDKNIKLNIIGRGVLLNQLQKKVIDLKLENQVEFFGFQENPFKLIKKCNLFVLPSKFEGFPNALIEAGVIGIPLVANNCKGGINEIINEKNGLISNYNSVEDLAYKISLIRNKEYESDIIKNDFITRFDISIISKKYYTFFKNLMENNTSPLN
jgi:glycosyltransferase involved in cell wall biosynthesis